MPTRPVSPGRILRRELDARRWSQRRLAGVTGLPAKTVAALVRGDEPLTPEIAEVLAAAFGTSAELWVKLEAAYRQTRAALARLVGPYRCLPPK